MPKKTGLILSKGYVIIRIKSMGDFFSLSSKEALKDNLHAKLKQIEKSFPERPERYVEIEL